MPPASAIRLAISVSSIDAIERKTSVSTSTATARPISSPIGAASCSAWSTTGPRRLTSSPACSPMFETVASRSPGARCMSWAGWSYWTVRKPTFWSLESWSGATPVTCGWRSISCLVLAIAALPLSVLPSVAKTIVAVSPDCAGKRCVRRSTACWDSVPGVLKLSTKAPPPTVAAVASATSTTATIARERFQCPAAEAARRPSAWAMDYKESHPLRNCNECIFALVAIVRRD